MASHKEEFNLNPEGFAPIRNGLREHVKKGKLGPTDLGIYLYLQMECNWSTGIYHGTAEGIAYGFSDASLKKLVQKTLRRLRDGGYINYKHGDGTRKGYDILIHKFRPRSGKLFGKELDAWKHGDKCVPDYVPAAVERLKDGGEAAEERRTGGGAAVEGRPIPEDQEELQVQEVTELTRTHSLDRSASLRPLRGNTFGETQRASLLDHTQGEPCEPLQGTPSPEPWSHAFLIDEDESTPPPVHSQQPQAREIPPASPKIVNRSQGHRFVQTSNGQKCLACQIHFSNYEKNRRPCPKEEMDIEAVDVSKPATPTPKPAVDFRNPMKTHKWNADTCAVCGVNKIDARLDNIFCEDEVHLPKSKAFTIED